MKKQFTGVLERPTTELAGGDLLRFTHLETFGDVTEGSQSLYLINNDGSYSFELNYGLILIEVKYRGKSEFINLRVCRIDESVTTSSLTELIKTSSPVTPDTISKIEKILTDAEKARDDSLEYSLNSEDSAIRSEQAAQISATSANIKGVFIPSETNATAEDVWIYDNSLWYALINTSATPSESSDDWVSLIKHNSTTGRDEQGAHPAASISLSKYLDAERRSVNIDWLELARPKNQSQINFENTGDQFIVFIGDSHTAGQGATGAAGNINEVPAMPAPSGVTDGFHRRDPAYGNFADLIAKDLRDKNYFGLRNRVIPTTETSFYNIYTGAWEQGSNAEANVFGSTNWAATSTVGNNVIKRGAPDFPRDWFEIAFRKYTLGAIVKFEFREVTQGGTASLTRLKYANWTLPSAITGCSRTDNPSDIDRVDTYAETSNYNNLVRFKLPYVGNWECRITIESAGNAGAGGTGLYIQSHKLEACQFLNAGRGNHTILDYLGEPVTVGAGGSGDMDHTDHLAEVLAYNPTLIIIEPMIINDWFHGVARQDTFSAFDEMLRRIKSANCECVILGPAPVITDEFPFDWSENPNSSTQPPLTDNIRGRGTYLQYYKVIERVAAMRGVSFIHCFWHYLYRFYKDDHQNWTIGDLAGRIHVNDVGHEIYRDAFIRYSGLADSEID